MKTPTTTIALPLKDGTQLMMTVNVVPKITGGIQRMPLDTNIFESHLMKSFDLADTMPTEREHTNIDMLLGNDYYLDIIEPYRVQLKSGLFLLGSKLGWILTGRAPVNSPTPDTAVPTILILTFSQMTTADSDCFTAPDPSLPLKPSLEELWDLESIGIKDSYMDSDDNKALEKFQETLQYENGRYWVTWPWKDDLYLPENYELAAGRLRSLVHKFQKSPDLLQKYDAIIQDQM